MIDKNKACIQIISSRQLCLEKCLHSIFCHYNDRYNYPVYVHYFDDVYDSIAFRNKIHNSISINIHFIKIPYETPGHIKEEDLFYNRTNLRYVRKSFSVKRKGYLHMCHFINNMYGYPNTLLHAYDYIMVYDDEAGYLKDLPYDPVEILSKQPEDLGALIVGQRLKDGAPHQGQLDCKIGLWEFTKNFILENNITPESQLLKDLMVDEDAKWNFHFLPWADSYVIKTKMFETDLWKLWIKAVNENGGVYKYRWGDNEIYSLFGLMHSKNGVYNFRTVEEGFHNQGLFRKIQNIAPNITHKER